MRVGDRIGDIYIKIGVCRGTVINTYFFVRPNKKVDLKIRCLSIKKSE